MNFFWVGDSFIRKKAATKYVNRQPIVKTEVISVLENYILLNIRNLYYNSLVSEFLCDIEMFTIY